MMDLKSNEIEKLVAEALEQIKFIGKLDISAKAKALSLASINIKLAEDIKIIFNSRYESNRYPVGGNVGTDAAQLVEKLMEEFISDKDNDFTEKQLNRLNKIWHLVCRASAESVYQMKIIPGSCYDD